MNQPEQQQNPTQDFIAKPIGQPSAAQPVMEVKPVYAQPSPQPAAKPNAFANFYHENRWYFLAIILGVAIIGLLAYFAFRKIPAVPAKQANVNISVDVPQTVPAGGEAVYQITVSNQDSQKLTQMSLELAYPEGEVYQSSRPNANNLSGTLFTIPDLIPGQNAALFLKTKVTGNTNDTKDLLIKLHYHYVNFNSDFVKQQTATIRLAAANVVLELDGPATANNAQLVVYTIKYQNNSSENITNARIQMAYPDGFSFATAQPQPDSGNNTWNLALVQPGNSGTITVQGNFTSSSPGESKTATAQFLVLGQDGQYFSQGSAEFTTALASLPLLVSQEVQNVSSDGVAKPGDILTFNIKYQNNASTPVNGVNILVNLDSKALDLSSLRAEGGQVSGSTILWNAASVSNLQTLNPSDSGQVSFSVKIKNPATKDSSKNLTVVSAIKIKSNEYDTYFPGNQQTVKISSPVNLAASVIFQSGSQPPQVGKANLYSVALSLTNSTNDFSGGVLTAFIPLGPGGFVSGSVNSAEIPNVQFDSSTGKLTWQVGSLSAHTGQFSSPRTLHFGARIIPSASQAGDTPTLVKSLQFSAKDSFTGQNVSATAEDLTTDSVSGGDGTVVSSQ